MPRPLVLTPKALRRELSGPEMGPFLAALGDQDLYTDKPAFEESIDEALADSIRTAQDKFETSMRVVLVQKRIATPPFLTGQVLGRDFDMEDDPYDFDAAEWRGAGTVRLRLRPVVSLQRLAIALGTTLPQTVRVFDNEYVPRKSRLGTLHVFEYLGKPSAGSTPYIFPHVGLGLQASRQTGHLAASVIVDYTAGMLPADFNAETDDLDDACPNYPIRSCVDVVRKMAALNVLQSLDDAIGAGGGSMSMEGLSESYDSQKFAARQGRYETRIDTEKKELAKIFTPLRMFTK